MEEIARIYSEISSKYLEEDFDWADLGSFGSADAYLLPLTSLKGRCLCIEGREDPKDASNAYRSNRFIKSKIESVKTFISDKRGKKYFFESPEGGGSSFYPTQDLISQVLEENNSKALIRKIVDCESLEFILDNKNLNCLFIKADLEGAEYESLRSIIDITSTKRPLILEVEINVGERGPFTSIGDGLAKYEKHGYRLIDMRKTYSYPKGKMFREDTINNDPIFAPHFQGCLNQADLLLINTVALYEPRKISKHQLLGLVLVLMIYRQFHLATKLLELRDEQWSREMISEEIPEVLGEFRKIAIGCQSALWGYHPLFNWLKAT